MRITLLMLSLLGLASCVAPQPIGPNPESRATTAAPAESPDQTLQKEGYSQEEMIVEARKFFGDSSEGLAKSIERAFADYGRPNAYIVGDEGSGAFIAGLRYGHGRLTYKGGGSMEVWWQGPTIGYDVGANASRVLTLVYNLQNTYQLFQRFPSVEGSVYVFAGFGLNYQRSGDIVLAPIRSGVGLRAGANLGYVHYTRSPSVIPF